MRAALNRMLELDEQLEGAEHHKTSNSLNSTFLLRSPFLCITLGLRYMIRCFLLR